jgi:NAD(P)-dependent dehydrogenase (short-subunit alcohol dehydrogenase family)
VVTPVSAVPRSPFGRRSTAEDVTAGLDLSGKTIVVTGSTSGIGLETVRVLALRGAHVIALGRTKAKAAQAIAGLKGAITAMGCNQEDFADVAACAQEIVALRRPLDAVIANAGILGAMELELIHGVAKPFAVNHLSHFILVNRLLPAMRDGGRIVMLSSDAHHRAPATGIAFDNLGGGKGYRAMECYGQSKLANHLFARAVAERVKGRGITANSLHPGVIATNIFSTLPPLIGALVALARPFVMKSVGAGAATTCYVATAPALAGVTGVYFKDCNPAVTHRNMENDALAAKLWAASEDLTRAYLT